MKNIAEFQIIGRIGRIAEVGKALKVDVAANYGKKDQAGVWRDDPYWNSITIFDEQTRLYVQQRLAKGDLVFTRGRIRQTSYQKDSKTIYGVDLIATEFTRLARPSEDVGE